MNININLPNIKESELDSATERRKIIEYLYQLNEQLRFVLGNLGVDNLDSELAKTIKDNAGNASAIEQTQQAITLKVSKGDVISAINQTAETIKILAKRIALEGYVTINGNFKIDENGTMTANNGILKGEIVGNSGSIGGFNISGGNLIGSNVQIYPAGSSAISGGSGGAIALDGVKLGGDGNALTIHADKVNIRGDEGDVSVGGDAEVAGTIDAYGGSITIGYVSGYTDESIVPSGAGVGNVGAGSRYWAQVKATSHPTGSSLRYKRNVVDITDADVGDIDQIRPIIYELKDKDDGKKYPGFIAEELAELAPLFVLYDEEGMPESIDYSKIVVLLVHEVKKLRKRMAALEK